MVERDPRPDAGGQQLVDEPGVEVDTRVVERTPSVGLDARPGDREAIGVDAELPHECDVVAVAVVVVAGDVARVAAEHLAGRVREAIPDRLTPAVLGHAPSIW